MGSCFKGIQVKLEAFTATHLMPTLSHKINFPEISEPICQYAIIRSRQYEQLTHYLFMLKTLLTVRVLEFDNSPKFNIEEELHSQILHQRKKNGGTLSHQEIVL